MSNQTGAGADLGGKAVAQAQPDGYTLLFTLDPALTANPNAVRQQDGLRPRTRAARDHHADQLRRLVRRDRVN